MTEKKDESLADLVATVELIDLGDAVDETKQLSPHGIHPDCYYGIGAKWGGCG